MASNPPSPPAPKAPGPPPVPPGVANLPPGYVSYAYFAFNPDTHHWIFSDDNTTWYDETYNPVPP